MHPSGAADTTHTRLPYSTQFDQPMNTKDDQWSYPICRMTKYAYTLAPLLQLSPLDWYINCIVEIWMRYNHRC